VATLARAKPRSIERDPRVVLSLETGYRNAMGLDEYLVVGGSARVTERGAPELLQRLAHVYLSSDTRFPPFDDPPPGLRAAHHARGDRRRRALVELTQRYGPAQTWPSIAMERPLASGHVGAVDIESMNVTTARRVRGQ
jgi:hypothetical protein